MTNEQILDNVFTQRNVNGVLGKDGGIYKAILEAMTIARKHAAVIDENPIDENGLLVDEYFLKSMLHESSSEDDFLNKVNYGIANEYSRVSQLNDQRIRAWYNRNKHLDVFIQIEPKTYTEDEVAQYDAEQEAALLRMFGKNKGNTFSQSGLTLKEYTLNWIEHQNRPVSSTEIRCFMYEATHPFLKYDPVENRGWYSAYFSRGSAYKYESGKSQPGVSPYFLGSVTVIHKQPAFSYPGRNDNRILVKNESGKYELKFV
jgi:hypothetical protein